MPSSPEALNRRLPFRLVALAIAPVIVAVTVWAYHPALDAGFVLDDTTRIVENPAIHWTELSWENLRVVRNAAGLGQRFVAQVSFGLNHVAGGLDPFGYHLVNVLIHLAVGGALAVLIGVYLRAHRPTDEESGRPIQLLVVAVPVALFLTHPLNTQAVTYVAQRATSLATFFALLSLAFYVGARTRALPGPRAAWLVAAALLWLLGIGTRENVLALPLVALVYEWCFHRAYWRDRSGSARSTRQRRPLIVAGTLLAGAGILLLLDVYIGGGRIGLLEAFPGRDFNGEERLATQARVHWLYLSRLAWPAPGRLNVDHHMGASRTLLTPLVTPIAILGLTLLLAGSLYVAIRKPRVGFALLAYWALHTIESGPVSLALVSEHRMYLPMALLALAAAVIVQDLYGRWRVPVAMCSVVVITLFATSARARNVTWSNPVTLAEDTARKSPLKRGVQADLAAVYIDVGRYEEAETALLRALYLDPNHSESRQVLGNLYLETGRAEEAARVFSETGHVEPDDPRVQYMSGQALEESGRAEEAFALYMELGTRYGMEGNPIAAIEPLRRAVSIQPESSVAHNSLGNVYAMADMLEEAVDAYRNAVDADSGNGVAVYNLAALLDRMGRAREALPYYRSFAELAPPELASYAGQAAERVRQIEAGGH